MIVNISKISKASLHYDVIVISYENKWYFFGINGKRRPVAIHWQQTKGYEALNIENIERGLQQPPFGGCVTENVSGGRGLCAITKVRA